MPPANSGDAATSHTSASVTPRTLPNRAASKFLVKLPMTEMIAIPIAKLADVTTPIAASAPIVFRRATFWISNADANPT